MTGIVRVPVRCFPALAAGPLLTPPVVPMTECREPGPLHADAELKSRGLESRGLDRRTVARSAAQAAVEALTCS